jgi:type VI protein secretion system component Hcp
MAIVAQFKDPDIVGSSQLSGFEGSIDVHHCSVGLYSPVSISGGGMSAGKSSMSEMSLTVDSGKHMPEILKKGTGGKHFGQVIISMLKQTGDKLELYKKYTLEQVYVTNQNDPTSGDDPGYENLSIAFAKMTTEYYEQDAKGGVALAGTGTYDTKTGLTT